jgi:hypothetical protein
MYSIYGTGMYSIYEKKTRNLHNPDMPKIRPYHMSLQAARNKTHQKKKRFEKAAALQNIRRSYLHVQTLDARK